MTDDYKAYEASMADLRMVRGTLRMRLRDDKVKGNEYLYAVLLIEGITAALDEREDYLARDDDKTHEFTQGIEFELRNFLFRMARAYKPHFKDKS